VGALSHCGLENWWNKLNSGQHEIALHQAEKALHVGVHGQVHEIRDKIHWEGAKGALEHSASLSVAICAVVAGLFAAEHLFQGDFAIISWILLLSAIGTVSYALSRLEHDASQGRKGRGSGGKEVVPPVAKKLI